MYRASQQNEPTSTINVHASAHHVPWGGAVLGFQPAFCDVETHEVHLSVDADGYLAAAHLLDGIPDHWVTERDGRGRIIALKDGIVAGYFRYGRFFTRSELARIPLDS